MADPLERKAHVKRIFLLDEKSGLGPSLFSEPWIDVLRIDMLPLKLSSASQEGKKGQIIKYLHHWNDDQSKPNETIGKGDAQQENAGQSRKTKKLEIKDPGATDDNPNSVFLWVAEHIRITMPRPATTEDKDVNEQTVEFLYKNAEPGKSDGKPVSKRKVTTVKIFNNDLGEDPNADLPMMQNEDGSSKIVDWKDYKAWLKNGNINRTQYLSTEIPKEFEIIVHPGKTTGQELRYILDHKDLEKLFDTIENPDPQNDDIYRLDPLQVIVNASFTVGFRFNVNGDNDYVTDGGGNGEAATTIQNLGPLSDGAGGPGAGLIALENLPAPGPYGGQSFTEHGSWHINVTSRGPNGDPGPGCSISPSSGSQESWEYRAAGGQGGPGYAPMSIVHPLSGGPLLDKNEKPITVSGFEGKRFPVIDTLFLEITGTTVYMGASIMRPTSPGSTDPGWPEAYPDAQFYAWARLEAQELNPVGQGISNIGGGGVTVSRASFKYNGKIYKALGLIEDPDHIGTASRAIYCERQERSD